MIYPYKDAFGNTCASTDWWEENNPVLAAGQIGTEISETATANIPTGSKMGDGATDFVSLPYISYFSGISDQFATQAKAITGAQTTADGKNTIYYSATMPSGGTYQVGDTWYDTSDGNKIYQWNGTSWVLQQFGTNALADGAVIADKIDTVSLSAMFATIDYLKANYVDTVDLQADYATIANLNATNANIQNLSTTKLDAQTATITYATISNLDATNSNITNLQSNVASINTLLAGNITASNIKAGSITADSAVIANGAIGTAQIATGAITNALIANAAISTAQIADASITDAKVISLTANKLTAGTIDASKITVTNLDAGNITTGTIDAGSGIIKDLTSDNIKAGAITASSLQAGLITANSGLIANSAIDTAQIADASVTDGKIVTLTANKLTAGTIDAGVINVVNMNCANLTVGTINGTQIASGTITSGNLAAAVNNAISTAQSTADGKNKIYYQSSQPSGGTYKSGDIWFNTGNGNAVSIYNGTSWALQQFDTGALTSSLATTISTANSNASTALSNASAAQTAASNAYTLAGTKNAIYYQSSQPSGGTYHNGDIWYNTGNGNAMSIYNGGAWVLQQFDTAALTSSLNNTISTASSNASNAVNTANSASSTAGTAASNASTALSTAQSAASTASSASTNASSAINTANSASNTASSALSTASTASSTAANALNNVNSIQFGGTNLLGGSGLCNGSTNGWDVPSVWSVDTSVKCLGYNSLRSIVSNATSDWQGEVSDWTFTSGLILPNTTYTASMYFYTDNISSFTSGFYLMARDENSNTLGVVSAIPSTNGIWQRFSFSFTTSSTPPLRIRVFATMQRNGRAWIACPKLEQATKVSDYSLCPIDISTGSAIFNGVLTGSQIAANTISATNLIAGTITSSYIASGTITALQIQAGTITSTQIAANTITGNNILAGTITASNIQSATITATQIASRTILASNIVSGAITSNEIAANTITANNIQASTITSAKIAAATITGSNIASQTISAGNIISATITATQIAANTIQGGNIAAGTITASNIQSATITTNQIAASTITGGNIQAGTITGTNIAANTITTNNLLIGSFTNLCENPSFTNNSLGQWTSIQVVSDPGINSTSAPTKYVAKKNARDSLEATFAVISGDSYNCSITAIPSSAVNDLYIGLELWDKNGGSTTWIAAATISHTVTSWTTVSGVITIPSGYVFARVWVQDNTNSQSETGYWYFTNVLIQKQNGQTLIANGAITTDKIVANAITAAKIAANTITSNQIASNTITAANIQSGTITSTQIAAGTITGSNIQSNTITASNILAGTITATQIASNTITGTNIASQTITASNIQSNTITANQIASNTITANQIASNTITASQIASGTITATQIASGTITAGNIDVFNLVKALNVSTYTLYAQQLTTTGSTVYGTIGDISGDGKTGFILRETNKDGTVSNLFRVTCGPYGDDGAPATIMDVNGSLTIKSDINNSAGAYMFLYDEFTATCNQQSGDSNAASFALQRNSFSVTIDQVVTGWTTFWLGSIPSGGQFSSTAGCIPIVKTDGVTEVGNAIDLHYAANDTSDYTARMRVNSDGSVAFTGGLYAENNRVVESPNTGSLISQIGWNTSGGYLYLNGPSGSWGVTPFNSDRQYKTNIADCSVDDLSVIRSIKFHEFDMIANMQHYDTGFIAQELPDRFTFSVPQQNGIDMLQIDTRQVIPSIAHAVQQLADDTDEKFSQLKSESDSLRSVIADLYGKNAQLENRIAKLERKVA